MPENAVAASGFCSTSNARLPEPQWTVEPDPDEIRDLLDGKWPALGFDWCWSDDEVAWRRAPDSGALWPRKFFGSIPYRAGNPYGDIRIAWEPARLQQLVELAIVAKSEIAAGSDESVALIESILLSWLRHNRPLEGIHYVSAMECGLRIIAVCHAVDMVRDRLMRPEQVWSAVVTLVDSHARLIERRLSLESAAGNHTIAECAGLVYAGTLFPELSRAAEWKELGLKYLCTEADRQILPDGGSLEQAFWYLLFIAELCGLVIGLLEHSGDRPPEILSQAYARSRQFIATLTGGTGDLPDFGDRDNGRALSPRLGLVLDGKRVAGSRRVTFPDAGCTLMNDNGAAKLQVLFDHGPLGMPPLFGHGHSDALSVVVHHAGRELLIDTGTFTYTGDQEWRRYFRSTEAHNTLTLDRFDQASQKNAFMWSTPYNCELIRAEDGPGITRVLARHDGYRRLGDTVHWRGVAMTGSALIIWDRIEGNGSHEIRIHWHCAVPVAKAAEHWELEPGLRLGLSGVSEVNFRTGPSDEMVGWRSESYGHREPIWTITGTANDKLPKEILTWLAPEGSQPSNSEIETIVEEFKNWVQANRNA